MKPHINNGTTRRSPSFKIVEAYGDGVLQSSMAANCREGKIFWFVSDIHDAQGKQVEHLDFNKARVPPRGSVGAKALSTVCHNAGAAGW